FTPFQVGRVPLGGNSDAFTVYNEVSVCDFHRTIEMTTGRVILQQTRQIIRLIEVIYPNNTNTWAVYCCPECQAANPAVSIDSIFHFYITFYLNSISINYVSAL